MDQIPTDRRAVIRLLLKKSDTLPANGQRRIEGYTIICVGEAQAKDWSGAPIEEGDVEAFLWTTPRQVEQVMRTLLAAEAVRWAKSSG